MYVSERAPPDSSFSYRGIRSTHSDRVLAHGRIIPGHCRRLSTFAPTHLHRYLRQKCIFESTRHVVSFVLSQLRREHSVSGIHQPGGWKCGDPSKYSSRDNLGAGGKFIKGQKMYQDQAGIGAQAFRGLQPLKQAFCFETRKNMGTRRVQLLYVTASLNLISRSRNGARYHSSVQELIPSRHSSPCFDILPCS